MKHFKNIIFHTFLCYTCIILPAKAQDVMAFYDNPISAPNVTWKNLDGLDISLNDFKGKVVLLNLWATWCTPCAIEMPAFNFLQKRYKNGGFEVVAVALNDTNEAVGNFMQKHKLDQLTPYIDSYDTVGKTFRPKSTPTTYLINRKGEVIAGKEGLSEWLGADMMAIIETELKKNQPSFTLPQGVQVIDRNDIHGGIHR